MTQGKRQSGFTLIELLLVIAIIAVLIAMTLPTLAAARRSAYSIKCGSHMKQLMAALTTYAFEHDGVLTYTNSQSGELSGNPNRWDGAGWLYEGPIDRGLGGPDYSEERREEGALWDYLSRTGEIYHCPLDDAPSLATGITEIGTRYMTSYVMNRAMNGWNETLPDKPAHAWELFRNPADSVAMWEGDETFSDPSTGIVDSGNPNGHWNDGNNDPNGQGPSVRHNASGTIGFLDGHVESWSWLTYSAIAIFSDTSVPNEMFCNPTTDDGRQPTP